MKHFLSILIFLTLVAGIPAQDESRPCKRSQSPWRFYRTDSVIREKGSVEAVHVRACYHDHRFMVIEIRTRDNKKFLVETAPREFLSILPQTGDAIEVDGSLIPCHTPLPLIIARRIVWRGQTFTFRDVRGFPLWRGKGKARQRRERSSRE